MDGISRVNKSLSTVKAILGIVFAILILVIAQSLSFSISEIFLGLGIPTAICNIMAGILYVTLTLVGVNILCKKYLKVSMLELRIPQFHIKKIWIIAAVLMPIMVLIISMVIGGHWKVNTFDTETTLATVTGAVIFYGLATGVVEEIIFRAVIMGCLEKRFNIQVAIVIPSVLFGALHIIGNNLNFISTIQLLIAGSIVGVLFSLIAYESNSVWNNALVHGVWNMAIIGGILHIGNVADNSSIFNFVLENKMFIFTGGDFGIEASVISILVYLIFCLIAVCSFKRQKK